MDTGYLDYCGTDRQRQVIQAVIDHGSARKAAAALSIDYGYTKKIVRNIKAKAAKAGYAPEHDLTKPAPIGYNIKGTSTLYHPNKGIVAQWVKTQSDPEQLREQVLDAIMDSFENFKGMSTPVAPVKESMEDFLTAYVMGDPHFGMLAHEEETGNEMNSEIASDIMDGAMDQAVAAAKPTKTALLVNVGDALHVDDSTNKTKGHGHSLDADTRYYKIIRVFCEAMIHAVYRMLEKHEEVIVINQSGNHDIDSTHWIQLALSYYFNNNPRVDVRINASAYNWIRWENNLIGITHGDGAKMNKLPMIMAHLKKEDWGQTDHHYWWVGHIHHKQIVQEHTGCTVESFNSITSSPDAWHARNGYFAVRELHSLTLHKKHGIISRSICPIGLALE